MQLGIFAYTFVRDSVEEVFDAIDAHGLSLAEWNYVAIRQQEVPDQIDEALATRVRTAAADRGITVASVAGYTNMVHPDPQQRREGMERLFGLIRGAHLHGTDTVALCTGSRDPVNMWQWHPSNDDSDAWDDLRTTMSDAVRVAEENDVRLVFEPEVNNVVHTAQKARQLLDEINSPRLKVVFDAANVFHKGELPRMHELLTESIKLIGSDIALAHAKDVDRDGEAGHVAAGHGKLDYEHYIGLLKKVGFSGSILLHGLAENQVDGCVRFVRQYID